MHYAYTTKGQRPTGQPNPKTGRRSLSGTLYAYATPEQRDEACAGDDVMPIRRAAARKTRAGLSFGGFAKLVRDMRLALLLGAGVATHTTEES